MVNGNQEATMKTVAISGACQRPGCTHNHGPVFAIHGESFRANPKRGLEASYRLYCALCGIKILETIARLAEKLSRNLPAD
jgi:hypothetical protein